VLHHILLVCYSALFGSTRLDLFYTYSTAPSVFCLPSIARRIAHLKQPSYDPYIFTFLVFLIPSQTTLSHQKKNNNTQYPSPSLPAPPNQRQPVLVIHKTRSNPLNTLPTNRSLVSRYALEPFQVTRIINSRLSPSRLVTFDYRFNSIAR